MNHAFVEHLSLNNFRSHQETDMSFSSGLNTLVGPNNAGKSSILEALNLILGDVYLARYIPPTSIFFK